VSSVLNPFSCNRYQFKSIIRLIVAIFFATLPAAVNAALPDLILKIRAPKEIHADQTFKVKVSVANRGEATARGTASNKKGYMIDLFLTRGKTPQGFTRFSKSYFDGVLLKGGRISRTVDLTRKKRHTYKAGVSAPADTPGGSYKICGRVDPAAAITETDNNNNLSCRNIKIINTANNESINIKDLKIVDNKIPVHVQGGSQGTATETATSLSKRTVLPDGTIEIRLPGGIRKHRAPNGQITTIYPDGTRMSSMALQVQRDELPPLPSNLSGWGQKASDELLAIIQHLLTEQEFNAYHQTENNKGFYDKMEWRIRSIDFLTRVE